MMEIPARIYEAGLAAVIVFLFVMAIFYITKMATKLKTNGNGKAGGLQAAMDALAEIHTQGQQQGGAIRDLQASLTLLCEAERRQEQILNKLNDTQIRLTTLLEYQQQMQSEFIKTQRTQNEILNRVWQYLSELRMAGEAGAKRVVIKTDI